MTSEALSKASELAPSNESAPPASERSRGQAESAFATRVGQAVRTLRKRKGWTQVQLAATSGLSSNYLARLERGEVSPSFWVCNKVTIGLGAEISALLTTTPDVVTPFDPRRVLQPRG